MIGVLPPDPYFMPPPPKLQALAFEKLVNFARPNMSFIDLKLTAKDPSAILSTGYTSVSVSLKKTGKQAFNFY